MSEARHTPGPWQRTADRTSIQDAAKTRTICKLNGHGNAADADARLIVWAPDMLTELRRLYEIHGYQSTFDVIAQATGTALTQDQRGG